MQYVNPMKTPQQFAEDLKEAGLTVEDLEPGTVTHSDLLCIDGINSKYIEDCKRFMTPPRYTYVYRRNVGRGKCYAMPDHAFQHSAKEVRETVGFTLALCDGFEPRVILLDPED